MPDRLINERDRLPEILVSTTAFQPCGPVAQARGERGGKIATIGDCTVLWRRTCRKTKGACRQGQTRMTQSPAIGVLQPARA